MNITKVSSKSLLGKTLRLPLKLIPREAVIPVLRGKLKGKKWIVGSSLHGCWMGTYEIERQRDFEEYVKPGSIVYDIGANVGFYTLLSSVLAGKTGHVYAFEPVPRNIYFLKKHIELNRLTNTTVIEAAVSDQNGVSFFDFGGNSHMGFLSETGGTEVKTVTLDDITLRTPDFLKIDVEGAESQVLEGARRLIRACRPIIFLAIHSSENHEFCSRFLTEHKYRILTPYAPNEFIALP